ncbi:MAG: NADPH-dependent F420 reductase [Actinomycetota bacterium]|nr:NADPH-dependent F420 reductase [Actinomycetota bacterium]
MDVAIVGGTGKEGFGLALRLLSAGHAVTIGSRSADRAADAVARAEDALGPDVAVRGSDNAGSVAGASVVVVTVPFAGVIEIYESIAPALQRGQVVLDATSPLMSAVGGKPWEAIRPWHGSAAELAAAHVPAGVSVVAGFHTIAAHSLAALDREVESDALLCADDDDAKRLVGGLIESVPGMRWVDAGPLANARLTEPLTPLIITINRRYELRDGGFRITGRDSWGMPDRP